MVRSAGTTAILLEPEGIRIPGRLVNLAAFRAWTRSPEFPERGRIDWIHGELEIDMSPEELNSHGTPKVAIATALESIVGAGDRGVVLVDRMRVVCQAADLSVEPDVVVVLFESVDRGNVRLVRAPGRNDERCIEIEGAPDLIVECVSNSSVAKDRIRLRARYARAGVPEYWIVDARSARPSLTVLVRAGREYRESRRDRSGFAHSPCLGLSVSLERLPPRSGMVRYRLG